MKLLQPNSFCEHALSLLPQGDCYGANPICPDVTLSSAFAANLVQMVAGVSFSDTVRMASLISGAAN